MTMTKNPISVGAAVDAQDFAGEQQGLLDLIDKLQFAQLDNVKLPQIVVVGDQSAGKSSVLEAITGTPFPREAGACTRFATEIRLRRANKENFSINIIPDRSRPLAEQKRLLDFGGTVDKNTPFDIMMRRAVEEIAPRKIPGRFATRDVLVVEKSGPKEPLLTLVDLPGLVRNANNDQSEEDIKAINDLTDKYMKSSRTIILAVVGGNGDYVQAPVLNKARKFDPSGGRTIGVLTKPDLTEHIGLEDKFIALVNNQDKHNDFKLGWYVLLNPGPRENGQEWPSAEERKIREDEFFHRGKWSSLPPSMCGVAALKQKLSQQLQRHIGRHVKTLRDEIGRALDECEAELKSLGTGKDTPEEMRGELIGLCSQSLELVRQAVDGTYKNPPGKYFFPNGVDPKGTPHQMLRARAVDENKRFAAQVREFAPKYNFTSGAEAQIRTKNGLGPTAKAEFARKEVERLIQQNTGTEFPNDYSPRLVYKLFQEHSKKWPKLAQEHKDNLGAICNQFLAEVIDYVWPQRMRQPLRKEFLEPQMKEMLKKARAEVETLQQDQQFEVQPYDPDYKERMIKWRSTAPEGQPYTEAEELLEKMLIHYELSSKVFITNVITQVVERHLLQGLYSTFNLVDVYNMDEQKVIDIAAEKKVTRDRRIALKAKKIAIEEAAEICASLSMNKELRSYSEEERDDEAASSDDEDNAWAQRQQPSTPRPHDTGSTARKATKAQQQQQQPQSAAQAQRVTPIMVDVTTNGYSNSSHDTPAPNYTAGDFQRTPGAWNEPPAPVMDYRSVPNEPQYPPPPPRRPDKQPREDPYFPVSPPDSGTRKVFPIHEQNDTFGADVSTNGNANGNVNGHRTTSSYPEVPARVPSNSSSLQQAEYLDDYARAPGKKQSRRLFGMKN